MWATVETADILRGMQIKIKKDFSAALQGGVKNEPKEMLKKPEAIGLLKCV